MHVGNDMKMGVGYGSSREGMPVGWFSTQEVVSRHKLVLIISWFKQLQFSLSNVQCYKCFLCSTIKTSSLYFVMNLQFESFAQYCPHL